VETFDTVIRVIGFFCVALGAVLAANVFRLKVTQEAERRLAQIQIETIEAQREQIATARTQTRLVEEVASHERLSREQCEEALRLAQSALDKWDQLIGSIWIDASYRAGSDIPQVESIIRAGADVDPRQLQGGDPREPQGDDDDVGGHEPPRDE
jgi:hypothetical protein